MATTPVDLYAFGNLARPRPPRPGKDILPDVAGMVGPEHPPLPSGASAFADVVQSMLSGHYHVLLQGTDLPPGIAVVADGVDVDAKYPHPPTHHTLYPAIRMPLDTFIDLILNLPWQYVGRK
ncbi:MAG TPA: hypothetical protein DDY78_16285 [Planctomycetales bacterium]|nr:hypothetical protein [Planctomycetales bacterium]